MNWINSYVRPKLNTLLSRREAPDNLWIKCEGCLEMVFHREWAENLHVCPKCAHHRGFLPEARFESLFDNGAYEIVDLPEPIVDPLQFRDQKRYAERLRETRKALPTDTSRKDAMLVGTGELHKLRCVAAAQDFNFMAGSMGMAVGDALLAGARKAVELHAPLIVFPAAGGARMQEGILSLMQMPRTTIAVQMVKEAGLPFISVLTDPTTGGVTASYAMLGDVQISEPGALICFAGPRVIEQTIREKLPEGFQRAEYLLEHGMLDRVVDRRKMRDELGGLLRMLVGAEPYTPPERGLPHPDGDSPV